MSPKPLPAAEEALRRRAEARLARRSTRRSSGAGDGRSDGDDRRLLHELQVHQVELELQNVELQEARDRLEALVEKYTDLYDFAPVGYFSLDAQGRILEANLAGATLLGVERSRLLGRRLPAFAPASERPELLRFLGSLFARRGGAAAHEVGLRRPDGSVYWASLHASAPITEDGVEPRCRVAVSDLTVLKQAEQDQRRIETLAVSNNELRLEILRREQVEASLRLSEQKHRRLLRQARHMHEELRRLSHELLRVQEEERKRISRDLHDDITQILVGINVHLAALAGAAAVRPASLPARIARTRRLVEKSLGIVQRFARELRPTALDDLGLIATLRSLLEEFMKRTGVRVRFSACAEVDRLDDAQLTVLYRVVQSALANVAAHARASQVQVSIHRRADEVRLEISDNGRGFDLKRVRSPRGRRRLGLLGMRERVEMVGGRFSVMSGPGGGTTILAAVPRTDRDPAQLPKD